MFTNRCLTVGFGVGVTFISCWLSLIDSPVFDILLSIAGATLGLLLAVLMMGMLLPRVNTVGVVSGLTAGLSVFSLIRLGIPQFGPDMLEHLGPLAGLKSNTWWDGLFATVPAVTVGVLASFLADPPRTDQLNGLLLSGSRQSSKG